MHVAKPPFAHTSGPQDARIAIVGEAHGEQEELTGQPFIGASGQELTRMLTEAGIARRECFLTNILAFRPPDNNNDHVLCVKSECGPGYTHTSIKQGKYLKPKYLPELERLRTELTTVNPNLIIATGNIACWALCGMARISALRGTTLISTVGPWKVLPTYHPAYVLRVWPVRPIVIADLLKAKREAGFPEVRRPERFIITNPTITDIVAWANTNTNAPHIAVDIETIARNIEMIGFAASPTEALVVPFYSPHTSDHNYWSTAADELEAWNLVERILTSRATKIFQNGLFDLQYIHRMGLRITNCNADTMLLHHSMYPEMQKSLGFLGSIYTNEPAWKLMRGRREELKRDE